MITYKELWLRGLVLLTTLASVVVYCQYDDKNSFSAMWESPIQPMFIFVNAITSYYFFIMDKWRLSGIFLLLLTAFSIKNFFIIHNVFAISFFAYSVIPIATDKRLSIYLVPYMLSLAFVNWPNIFFSEIIAISTLCAFHAHKLYFQYKIMRTRKKLQ